MSLIPFANCRVMPCSSLQASQHWSIPHFEILLRLRERGLPVRAHRQSYPHCFSLGSIMWQSTINTANHNTQRYGITPQLTTHNAIAACFPRIRPFIVWITRQIITHNVTALRHYGVVATLLISRSLPPQLTTHNQQYIDHGEE
jgi:hypothetical protein